MLSKIILFLHRKEIQSIFAFFIIFILLLVLWIRWKHRFWLVQPVFHTYNLYYWLFPPGIIDQRLPRANNYFEPLHGFSEFQALEPYEIDNAIDLIKGHYLQDSRIKYNPSRRAITGYFEGHSLPCYFSMVYKTNAILDFRNKQVLKKRKPISIMTTRPLELTCNKEKTDLRIYYVDFLCTHKKHRKKGITQRNIYTHYVNYRRQDPENMINFFKREGPQSVFVPMVRFLSYGFHLKRWTVPPPFHPSTKVVEVSSKNTHILEDYLRNNCDEFVTVIRPDITHISSLIKTDNVYCYMLLIHDQIHAAYFFRNAFTYYKKYAAIEDVPDAKMREKMSMKGNSIEFFASIHRKKLDENGVVADTKMFVDGFYHSVHQVLLKKDFRFRVLVIENISNNNRILKNVMRRYRAIFKVENGYYYYNFALRPELAKDVLVIT